MSVTNIVEKVQYVIDSEGRKTAVVLDYALWDKLLTLLEDLEDAEELQALHEIEEETIPWEQARAELRAKGVDV